MRVVGVAGLAEVAAAAKLASKIVVVIALVECMVTVQHSLDKDGLERQAMAIVTFL